MLPNICLGGQTSAVGCTHGNLSQQLAKIKDGMNGWENCDTLPQILRECELHLL